MPPCCLAVKARREVGAHTAALLGIWLRILGVTDSSFKMKVWSFNKCFYLRMLNGSLLQHTVCPTECTFLLGTDT